MVIARLLTIGTEITNGEVINSNAAWISRKLEEVGCRVFSHLSVRGSEEEILQALAWGKNHTILIVTGGLGPTSDDITRNVVAKYAQAELEFDPLVHRQLAELYKKRGLPLREAHRQQYYFPVGSERLANSVGTALGFYLEARGEHIFVLPGPPRGLESMWNEEVARRLSALVPSSNARWTRWTCLGAPESEVAEVVEPVVSGHEVGYRAQVPYVRVKVYSDPADPVIARIEGVLKPWLVPEDLARELIQLWPGPRLKVRDRVCATVLFDRLEAARASLGSRLELEFHTRGTDEVHLETEASGDETLIRLRLPNRQPIEMRQALPYKIPLASERGRRSMAEWVLWSAWRALSSQS